MIRRRHAVAIAALALAIAHAPPAEAQVGNAIGVGDPKYSRSANAPPTAQLTFVGGEASQGALSNTTMQKVRAWMNCNIYNSYQANDAFTREMCQPKDQAWTLQGSGVNIGENGGSRLSQQAWIQFFVFSPTVTPQATFQKQDLCFSANDINRMARYMHEEFEVSSISFSCNLNGGGTSEKFWPCLCPAPPSIGVDESWKSATIALAVLFTLSVVILFAIGIVRCFGSRGGGGDEVETVEEGSATPIWRL